MATFAPLPDPTSVPSEGAAERLRQAQQANLDYRMGTGEVLPRMGTPTYDPNERIRIYDTAGLSDPANQQGIARDVTRAEYYQIYGMTPEARDDQKHMEHFHPAEYFGTTMGALQGMTLSQIASRYGSRAADYVQDYSREHPSAAFLAITQQYEARQYSSVGSGTNYGYNYGTKNPFPEGTAAWNAWVTGRQGGSVSADTARIADIEAKILGVAIPSVGIVSGMSTVPTRDLSYAATTAQPLRVRGAELSIPGASIIDVPSLTTFAPYGDRRQTALENTKLALSYNTGEIGIYQKNEMWGTWDLIGGGGRAAAQSGMFSVEKPLTPWVVSQISGGSKLDMKYANKSEADLNEVMAHPENFSRLGAEAYSGYVRPLDGRRLDPDAQMSRYAGPWNLANYVNPKGANLGKSEAPGADIPWAVLPNSPAIQYMNEKGLTGQAVVIPGITNKAIENEMNVPTPFLSTSTAAAGRPAAAATTGPLELLWGAAVKEGEMLTRLPSVIFRNEVNMGLTIGMVAPVPPSARIEAVGFREAAPVIERIPLMKGAAALYREVAPYGQEVPGAISESTAKMLGAALPKAEIRAAPLFESLIKYGQEVPGAASRLTARTLGAIEPEAQLFNIGAPVAIAATTAGRARGSIEDWMHTDIYSGKVMTPGEESASIQESMRGIGINGGLIGRAAFGEKSPEVIKGAVLSGVDFVTSLVGWRPGADAMRETSPDLTSFRSDRAQYEKSLNAMTAEGKVRYGVTEAGEIKIDVTNPEAVAFSKKYDTARGQYEQFMQTAKDRGTLVYRGGQLIENPELTFDYGEFSKWGAGAGLAIQKRLGFNQEQLETYGLNLEQKKGIEYIPEKLVYGAGYTFSTHPEKFISAYIGGGLMVAGGAIVGGLAEGAGITGAAASWAAAHPTAAAISGGLVRYGVPLGLMGLTYYGASEGLKATPERTTINLGKMAPELAGVTYGAGSAYGALRLADAGYLGFGTRKTVVFEDALKSSRLVEPAGTMEAPSPLPDDLIAAGRRAERIPTIDLRGELPSVEPEVMSLSKAGRMEDAYQAARKIRGDQGIITPESIGISEPISQGAWSLIRGAKIEGTSPGYINRESVLLTERAARQVIEPDYYFDIGAKSAPQIPKSIRLPEPTRSGSPTPQLMLEPEPLPFRDTRPYAEKVQLNIMTEFEKNLLGKAQPTIDLTGIKTPGEVVARQRAVEKISLMREGRRTPLEIRNIARQRAKENELFWQVKTQGELPGLYDLSMRSTKYQGARTEQLMQQEIARMTRDRNLSWFQMQELDFMRGVDAINLPGTKTFGKTATLPKESVREMQDNRFSTIFDMGTKVGEEPFPRTATTSREVQDRPWVPAVPEVVRIPREIPETPWVPVVPEVPRAPRDIPYVPTVPEVPRVPRDIPETPWVPKVPENPRPIIPDKPIPTIPIIPVPIPWGGGASGISGPSFGSQRGGFRFVERLSFAYPTVIRIRAPRAPAAHKTKSRRKR